MVKSVCYDSPNLKKKNEKTKKTKNKQTNKQNKTKADRLGSEYSEGDLAKMLNSKYLGINV